MPSTHHYEPPAFIEPVVFPHHRFTLHYSAPQNISKHIPPTIRSALVQTGTLSALVQTNSLSALIQKETEN